MDDRKGFGSAFPEQYYLVYGHQEVGAGALEWVKNKILYWTSELEEREQVNRVYQIFDKLVDQAEPGAGGDDVYAVVIWGALSLGRRYHPRLFSECRA